MSGWWIRLLRYPARWLSDHPAVRGAVPFVLIVLAWQVTVALNVFPRAFFPSPGDVLASFGNLLRKGILPAYLSDSLIRLLWGSGVGILIGFPLGLLVGLNRYCYRFLWPLVLFFQAVGDIAWLPILLVWFGFGLATMTFVIFYTVMFPIVFNVSLGVRTIRPELVRAAQSLGAPGWRILGEVLIPGTMPNLITGLRNGLGYGWRALIAAEIIVGTSGLGFMMFDARRSGQVTDVIVGMIILGVLWYLVDGLLLVPVEKATVERWGMVTEQE